MIIRGVDLRVVGCPPGETHVVDLLGEPCEMLLVGLPVRSTRIPVYLSHTEDVALYLTQHGALFDEGNLIPDIFFILNSKGFSLHTDDAGVEAFILEEADHGLITVTVEGAVRLGLQLVVVDLGVAVHNGILEVG